MFLSLFSCLIKVILGLATKTTTTTTTTKTTTTKKKGKKDKTNAAPCLHEALHKMLKKKKNISHSSLLYMTKICTWRIELLFRKLHHVL